MPGPCCETTGEQDRLNRKYQVNPFDITTNAAEGKANGEGAGAPGRDKAPHGNGYDHEAAGRDRARRFDPNSPEQLAYIAALDRGLSRSPD